MLEIASRRAKRLIGKYVDGNDTSLTNKHGVVVIDPPWYPYETRLFISRARELLSDSGFILCVRPHQALNAGSWLS